MSCEPSPWPWKIEDNQGRSYKIVAADKSVIAYMHYPTNTEQAANCKLVERCPELLDKFKKQQTIMEAMVRQLGHDPKDNAFLKSAARLIAELDIRTAVKEPPGSEGGG